VKKIVQLNGTTVCVEKGTTHLDNLTDFSMRGMKVTTIFDSTADVSSAPRGRRAYTSDARSSQQVFVFWRSGVF
jgi:hypothetical protein